MAGSGWNSSTVGAGVTVSANKVVAARPTGDAESYAGVRGGAGRAKGTRYFEVDATDAFISVGLVDETADLGSKLGSGSASSQWGFWLSDGYLYYRDSVYSGSIDTDSGGVAAGIIGVLVNLEAKRMTIFADGEELFTQLISYTTGAKLYPAISMGVGAVDIELITKEPFNYPPESNFVPWDLFDGSILSHVSGSMKIDGEPVARKLKAFTYDRQAFVIDNASAQESRPLGETVSDGSTGNYEITLRGGYAGDIFVVAFDDYGSAFEADAAVSAGERVHPTTPTGYVYECSGSGDLPSDEPDPWPTDTESSYAIGTASFVTKPFYRPECHGPIKPASSLRAPLRPGASIACGDDFSVAIRADGTVAAWGYNNYGQTTVPAGAINVIQIACGKEYAIALKSDGTIVIWGRDVYTLQSPPAISTAVAVAAGHNHALALLDDGTVVTWGDTTNSVNVAPSGLSAIAIAGGAAWSAAIRSDGSIARWGSSSDGLGSPPAGYNFKDLSACGSTGYAIKHTGESVAWGSSLGGLNNIPAELIDPVQISDGTEYHVLGLSASGDVLAWGVNSYGETDVPEGLGNVVAVAAGRDHSLAVKMDGTVVGWGRNNRGQISIPAGLIAKIE